MQSVRVTVAGSSTWNMTGDSDKDRCINRTSVIKFNLLCRFSARDKRKFIYAELTLNLCLELTRSLPTVHKSYPGACTCTNMFFSNMCMWYFGCCGLKFCLCNFCIIWNIKLLWEQRTSTIFFSFFHNLTVYYLCKVYVKVYRHRCVFRVSFGSPPLKVSRLCWGITTPNLHLQTSALNTLSGVCSYVQWCD